MRSSTEKAGPKESCSDAEGLWWTARCFLQWLWSRHWGQGQEQSQLGPATSLSMTARTVSTPLLLPFSSRVDTQSGLRVCQRKRVNEEGTGVNNLGMWFTYVKEKMKTITWLKPWVLRSITQLLRVGVYAGEVWLLLAIQLIAFLLLQGVNSEISCIFHLL